MKTEASANKRLEKKLRKKYRGRCVFAFLLALIIGFCGGIYAVRETSVFDSFLDGKTFTTYTTPVPTPDTSMLTFNDPGTPAPAVIQTTPAPAVAAPADTEAPTETTETEAPAETAVPTAAPVSTQDPKENPIPFGESVTFETEVLSDGTPRTDAAQEEFSTLKLTMTVRDTMNPAYFALKYSSMYKLKGNEAGVKIDLSMSAESEKATIIPQNIISLSFENADGEVFTGYQLMDAEIAGNYDITLSRGETGTLYKRYAYSEDMGSITYMVMTYYKDGQECRIYFSLNNTNAANVEYPTLKTGSHGLDVTNLQSRLIKLGYLSGVADGQFGKKTEDAVKSAQIHYGLEQTGIADNALQQKLFNEQ